MRCNPHVFPLILNNVYHRTLRKSLLQSDVEEVDSICSPQPGHRQQKNNQGNNDSHSFTSYIYRYKNKRFAHPERSFLWNILSNPSHFP